MKKFDFKKIDVRKLTGTLIGGIFFIVCILYFTYAYYEWKSDNTNVVLGIQDVSTSCVTGPDVNVTNIGPVLNPQDGVKAKFNLMNDTSISETFSVNLNITSISENLLVDSFKYMLISGDDYDNPIAQGDFSDFVVGSNYITTTLTVLGNTTALYQFIVYIDGTVYNNSNMQENSLVANLEIGDCGIINGPNMMKSLFSAYNDYTYFRSSTYREKVKTASFVDYIDTSNAALDSDNNAIMWDVSVNEDESIIAWLQNNATTGYYDLYIGSESLIYTESFNSFFMNMVALQTVSFDNLDTSLTTNMQQMFASQTTMSLISLDLSEFDTSNVTNMANMFRGCTSLTSLDVSSFDTSKVTNMSSLFSDCSKLTSLDVSNFDTSNVTDMHGVFFGCEGLTSLDVSKFNTSKVTDMGQMFWGCINLTSLDLRVFDTSKVTTMLGMFYECSSLTSLNISNFVTSNVTDMGNMFRGCLSLTSLDVSNFVTSAVTDMQYMFANCSGLTSLVLSNFNTSAVTVMNGMFQDCSGLTSLDLSNFVTSNVTNMATMFERCSKLTSINLSSFDTTKVTTMANMFGDCVNLETLDLSNFNMSSVIYTGYMFGFCSKLVTTITIRNTEAIDITDSYVVMFNGAATTDGAQITVNYTSATSTLVDNMIATKSDASNVVKGSQVT